MNKSANEETGSYVALTFWRAPKKNRDAMTKIGKQNDQIWRKHGMLRSETFLLSAGGVPPGCESIAKVVSAAEGEDVWILQQFFRDQAHADKVLANLIKDEGINKIVEEFYGLGTQGQRLITGGLDRLK